MSRFGGPTISLDDSGIDSPSLAFCEMWDANWDLITSLLGGTPMMRARRTDWLPMQPREQIDSYNFRLQNSFLFEAFEHGVDRLSDRPFTREIILKGEYPAFFDTMARNTDRIGTTITQLAHLTLNTGIAFGLSHIFVDYDRLPPGATAADEQAALPTFIPIHPTELFSWRYGRSNSGQPLLTEIRWKWREVTYDGFRESYQDVIRIWTETEWAIYHLETITVNNVSKQMYRKFDSGPNTLGKIPLVTFYTKKTGFLTAKPPLASLAWLNLAHWVSQSDYRNAVRFSLFSILFGKGLPAEKVGQSFTLGANSYLGVEEEQADLKFVESTGSALNSGRIALHDVESHMEILSLQPLIQKVGGISATGRAIDESKAQTTLQTWTLSLEKVIWEAFGLATEWKKTPAPSQSSADLLANFEVDIFSDFGISPSVRDDCLVLLEARANGEIDSETLLEEFKRRGILVETTNILDVIRRAKADPPAALQLQQDNPPNNPSGISGGGNNASSRLGGGGLGTRNAGKKGSNGHQSKRNLADNPVSGQKTGVH